MKRNVYVNNDVYLDKNNYVLLITGPNMGVNQPLCDKLVLVSS